MEGWARTFSWIFFWKVVWKVRGFWRFFYQIVGDFWLMIVWRLIETISTIIKLRASWLSLNFPFNSTSSINYVTLERREEIWEFTIRLCLWKHEKFQLHGHKGDKNQFFAVRSFLIPFIIGGSYERSLWLNNFIFLTIPQSQNFSFPIN